MVNQVAVGQVPSRVFRFLLATIISSSLLNLTPWRTVLVERLIDPQLVQAFPEYYGSCKFITLVTASIKIQCGKEQICLLLVTTTIQNLIIKPTRCTNFSNLFWNEILHVSDSSSVHRQEFFTVHTAMVYVIQVCRQLSSSRIKDALKLSTNMYGINHCCVFNEKLLMMDRGTVRNM
jgi:hypothetical protein